MHKEHFENREHDWSVERGENEEHFEHQGSCHKWHHHHYRYHRYFPVRGQLHLLILKLLSEKPLHGSEIRDLLKEKLEIDIPSSAIYAILTILEEKDMIISKWETGERGPARKLYSITEYGLEYLREKIDELKRFKKVFEFLTS